MNHLSPGGTPHGRRPEGAGGRTVLLWFAVILATAALAWLLLALSGITDATTSLIAVAWIMVLLSVGLSALTRRAQKRRFRQRFPTLDHLRRHVDTDALRAVRDRDGEVSAVKQLRRRVPGVPLSEAVQLIRNL